MRPPPALRLDASENLLKPKCRHEKKRINMHDAHGNSFSDFQKGGDDGEERLPVAALSAAQRSEGGKCLQAL